MARAIKPEAPYEYRVRYEFASANIPLVHRGQRLDQLSQREGEDPLKSYPCWHDSSTTLVTQQTCQQLLPDTPLLKRSAPFESSSSTRNDSLVESPSRSKALSVRLLVISKKQNHRESSVASRVPEYKDDCPKRARD